MVEVKRRKGESFEGLMRRFSRRLSESGRMLEARKGRFHTPKPNKNAIRTSAIRGMKIRDRREYLIKSGRLVENTYSRGRNRR